MSSKQSVTSTATVKKKGQRGSVKRPSTRYSRKYTPFLPEIKVDESERSLGSIRREKKREIYDNNEVIVRVIERKKLHNWEQVHDLGAGDAFKILYGFNPEVNLFATEDLGPLRKTFARKWWERAGVPQQCENVIGRFDTGVTTCYICGFPITTIPECEHVLPVFKAAMYLHLYRDDYKTLFQQDKTKQNFGIDIKDSNDNPIDDSLKQILKKELGLEYKWAHRCCNQIKGETDFIKYENGSFQLDYHTTVDILNRIISSSKSDVNNKREDGICYDPDLYERLKIIDTKDKKKKWIAKRIDILQSVNNGVPDGVISSITEYLNENKGKMSEGIFMLSALSQAILAADMKDVWRVKYKLTGKEYQITQPVEEVVSKSQAIMEASIYSAEYLGFDFGRNLKPDQISKLYSQILGVDLLQFEPRRDTTNISFENFTMTSIQFYNDNNEFYRYFYRDIFALIYYSDEPIIVSTGKSNKDKASKIASNSYSILILLTYNFNLESSIQLLEELYHDSVLRYTTIFFIQIESKLKEIETLIDNYENFCKYLHFLKFLLKRIFPTFNLESQFKLIECTEYSDIQQTFLETAVLRYILDNYSKEELLNKDDIIDQRDEVEIASMVKGLLELSKSTEKMDEDNPDEESESIYEESKPMDEDNTSKVVTSKQPENSKSWVVGGKKISKKNKIIKNKSKKNKITRNKKSKKSKKTRKHK